MTMTFMEGYGGWWLRHVGTADKWPPRAQLRVAYSAVRVRGYSPWPTTARLCGLL